MHTHIAMVPLVLVDGEDFGVVFIFPLLQTIIWSYYTDEKDEISFSSTVHLIIPQKHGEYVCLCLCTLGLPYFRGNVGPIGIRSTKKFSEYLRCSTCCLGQRVELGADKRARDCQVLKKGASVED